MSKLKIRHGIGEITALMPANIIFGVAPGASVPLGWNNWTLANGFFLKGTDSDSLVNTFSATDIISYGSSSSGGHTNRGPELIGRHGRSNVPTGDELWTPSVNYSSEGSHSHVLTVDYEPAAFNLRLVQAQQDTYLFPGAICFSAVAQPDHQPYADNVGMLKAGNVTETTPAAGSPSVADANDAHDHIIDVRGDADNATTMRQISNSGGGMHRHTWTPSFSHNVRHALMRVYQIVNINRADNIVGIWAETGAIPDGWELVAELVDNYLMFSTLGDGAVSGNNTVDIVGNTGSESHEHTKEGTIATVGTLAPHTGPRSHFHNGSRSGIAFEPERYHVKFIRKLP